MRLDYKDWKALYYLVRDYGVEKGWLITREISKTPSLLQSKFIQKRDKEEELRRKMMGH